jgi:Protein of unknown function N-terminus (DUF3323)
VAEVRGAVRSEAEASPLHASCGWYREWLAGIEEDGMLTKLVKAGEQARFGQTVRVLEYLGSRSGGPVLLPALAANVIGDTGERRDLWEAAGVVVDDLASRVVVLNISAEGHGLAGWLARHGSAFCSTSPCTSSLRSL